MVAQFSHKLLNYGRNFFFRMKKGVLYIVIKWFRYIIFSTNPTSSIIIALCVYYIFPLFLNLVNKKYWYQIQNTTGIRKIYYFQKEFHERLIHLFNQHFILLAKFYYFVFDVMNAIFQYNAVLISLNNKIIRYIF